MSTTDPAPTPVTSTGDLDAELERLSDQGAAAIAGAVDTRALQGVSAELLGKRSSLSRLNRRLGGLDAEGRKTYGERINGLRKQLAAAVEAQASTLARGEREAQLEADRLDLTEAIELGGPEVGPEGLERGHLHLITQTLTDLEDIFVGMGFTIAEGPEAEDDWYNFEALNLPPQHPARSMWDTLYLELGEPETVLLRTHTSPVQIHLMESQPPPIYSVMPGRCYRNETPDARHLPVFHQLEGLVVDEGISFADLAGTIEEFSQALFGSGVRSRLRPSFFPFTEPSAEFDVSCPNCGGTGCRTCSGSGWLELGGCGMVDPNVLAAVGIDYERYTGFAFGFGIDRLAMTRNEIGDIRSLLENDVRFVSQF